MTAAVADGPSSGLGDGRSARLAPTPIAGDRQAAVAGRCAPGDADLRVPWRGGDTGRGTGSYCLVADLYLRAGGRWRTRSRAARSSSRRPRPRRCLPAAIAGAVTAAPAAAEVARAAATAAVERVPPAPPELALPSVPAAAATPRRRARQSRPRRRWRGIRRLRRRRRRCPRIRRCRRYPGCSGPCRRRPHRRRRHRRPHRPRRLRPPRPAWDPPGSPAGGSPYRSMEQVRTSDSPPPPAPSAPPGPPPMLTSVNSVEPGMTVRSAVTWAPGPPVPASVPPPPAPTATTCTLVTLVGTWNAPSGRRRTCRSLSFPTRRSWRAACRPAPAPPPTKPPGAAAGRIRSPATPRQIGLYYSRTFLPPVSVLSQSGCRNSGIPESALLTPYKQASQAAGKISRDLGWASRVVSSRIATAFGDQG